MRRGTALCEPGEAGGGGFEPPLPGPEPGVLPLDDPPSTGRGAKGTKRSRALNPAARGDTPGMSELELVVRAGHPDFLDLPWSAPLAEWRSDRIVRMARGVSRHIVRF